MIQMPDLSDRRLIMSVLMALVDFLPVILFIISAVTLQRGLYCRMSKGAFVVFSAGTIMVICAGIFKAVWKLLYGAGTCDFARLNQAFFPMQSVGFLLAGIAVIAMVFFRQDTAGDKLYAAGAPAVFSGTIIFIIAMVLGALGLCGGLAIDGRRRGKTGAVILFILSFIFMLMMGYLGTKDFAKPSLNWIGECVNLAGQVFFLLASKELVQK